MKKGEKRTTKKGNSYYNYYKKKHPNGMGKFPYSEFNKKLCLKRDNNSCQICGSTQNLDVHHKDNGGPHIKGRGTDNSLSNLQTLCHRCHLQLHYGVLGRSEKIKVLRESGMTLQEIANHYRVSRQRIHQLLNKATL